MLIRGGPRREESTSTHENEMARGNHFRKVIGIAEGWYIVLVLKNGEDNGNYYDVNWGYPRLLIGSPSKSGNLRRKR